MNDDLEAIRMARSAEQMADAAHNTNGAVAKALPVLLVARRKSLLI